MQTDLAHRRVAFKDRLRLEIVPLVVDMFDCYKQALLEAVNKIAAMYDPLIAQIGDTLKQMFANKMPETDDDYVRVKSQSGVLAIQCGYRNLVLIPMRTAPFLSLAALLAAVAGCAPAPVRITELPMPLENERILMQTVQVNHATASEMRGYCAALNPSLTEALDARSIQWAFDIRRKYLSMRLMMQAGLRQKAGVNKDAAVDGMIGQFGTDLDQRASALVLPVDWIHPPAEIATRVRTILHEKLDLMSKNEQLARCDVVAGSSEAPQLPK